MGTHPIFESDFDCLTDVINRLEDEINAIDDKPAPLLPMGKQVAIGLTGGALTGAVVGRTSRGAAVVVGSGLVAFSLASSFGVLDEFDQRQAKRDMCEARRQLDDELRKAGAPTTGQIREFFVKNKTLSYCGAGSFIAA